MKLVITDARIKTSARELWPCVEANEEGNVKIAYQTRKASKELKKPTCGSFSHDLTTSHWFMAKSGYKV